jgi:hypothetical protein
VQTLSSTHLTPSFVPFAHWPPSSQSSVLSLTPLPHSSQGAPTTGQAKPSSMSVQVALQPSPAVALPSSQSSVPSWMPLPHWLQTVRLLITWQVQAGSKN